mmetsp:Transcript_20852/g.31462  ORF Transcript_20852/g.31462 Transcript_20852/m.31462 type:complete len:111 (+) Transcript_20852:69-401(+)
MALLFKTPLNLCRPLLYIFGMNRTVLSGIGALGSCNRQQLQIVQQMREMSARTNKAAMARFRLTKNGKIKRGKAGHSHNTGKLSSKRTMRLAAVGTCEGKIAKNIKKMIS